MLLRPLHNLACRGSMQFPPSKEDIEGNHMLRAAELADKSAGFTAPHPNAGCVLAHGARVVGEAYQYAQGTTSAEVQAVQRAGERARGATAYLNLEPGDCHGDESAVKALKQGGISRVVVGLHHPLKHIQGNAISALRNSGIVVDVLREDQKNCQKVQAVLKACELVNLPLLYTAAHRIPFSVLKYAMTLDGKIAASTGHSAWVSSKLSRKRVFETRGRSDAIIVGGTTVYRDNPRLTTRKEGGHFPLRIVMSRGLKLPEFSNLWDVSRASTIVMTQHGACREFQKKLQAKGVEVVEFDHLTPKHVMDYCYSRGFLSVLWECGGTLAAPAISSGVIHKVIAFLAPKIIGGVGAPSPVGELGMVEMTQALILADVSFEQIGPDFVVSGFLKEIPDVRATTSNVLELQNAAYNIKVINECNSKFISFYKAWNPYGAFSNFSPHPISISDAEGCLYIWKSTEHYYQAQKFKGVQDSIAEQCVRDIQEANSPEEAAQLGRALARERPDLVCSDWASRKLIAMYEALSVKFSMYPDLRNLLLSTIGCELVEASPHDYFWGCGRDRTGYNYLGKLLMKIRTELQPLQPKENLTSSSRASF